MIDKKVLDSVPEEIGIPFVESLQLHIANVQEAGRSLGVPQTQLDIHDDSKWSVYEFPAYARYFHKGSDESPLDSDNVPDDFARAWLHHIHHNPHHWQHWIFSDGFSPKGSTVQNGVVRMPDNYALEMVADWMGASKSYTGSWDMTEWLNIHIPKIKLHSETAKFVRDVLSELGYKDLPK